MINNIHTSIYPLQVSQKRMTSPSFKGTSVETLKHTNIGSCLNGYIGKVKARKAATNEECLVNVFKRNNGNNHENYSIRNDNNDILGEIDIVIKKYDYNPQTSYESADPSHVFVDNLRNYSKPDTPYYKQGLEHIKDIGIRLLQIAQRRSDEAQCVGNIKLISKNESKDWYKNVIGMTEEFPIIQTNSRIRFNVHNPNAMILPPLSKEPLSRLNGGL
ncbi:MAG: hypothetical protein NC200_07720 [Candidatus Gastranaerophilales bacterium]|nr:hypothetical protein [Candidatus Gastranaerophilales bacterium]